MALERGLVKEGCLGARHPAGMAHQHAGKAVGADDIHLASFHRQHDVARAPVAAYNPELRAGIGRKRSREQHRGGAAAGGADSILSLTNILERFDAGCRERGADIDIGHHAADIRHARKIEPGIGIRHAVERQRLREAAEHGAVPGRDVLEISCGREAPRSRHVLGDDDRVAGQMPRQKLGDQPAVDVVAAARPVSDDHPQRLAAIKIRGRLRPDRQGQRSRKRGRSSKQRQPAAARILRHSAWNTLFTHHSASSMPVGNQRSPAFLMCWMMPRSASVRPGRPMM